MSKNRNFATEPRTLRESIGLILKTAGKGRLTTDAFCKDDKYDIIGCLLTPRQRTYLRREGVAEDGFGQLLEKVGKKNVEAMTGMSVKQAEALWDDHQTSENTRTFTDNLRALLKNGQGKIGGVEFKL